MKKQLSQIVTLFLILLSLTAGGIAIADLWEKPDDQPSKPAPSPSAQIQERVPESGGTETQLTVPEVTPRPLPSQRAAAQQTVRPQDDDRRDYEDAEDFTP